MGDSGTIVARLSSEAYFKVLRCITKQQFDWSKEKLLFDLRKQLNISNDLHHALLTAALNGEESFPTSLVAADKNPSLKVARAVSRAADSVGHATSQAPEHEVSHASTRSADPRPVGIMVNPQSVSSEGSLGSNLKRKRKVSPPPTAPPVAAPAPPRPPLLPGVDPLIGRKVKRYWPEDGGWFVGVITDLRKESGEYCITYDLGSSSESWEWYRIRAASRDNCRLMNEYVDILSGMPHASYRGHTNGASAGKQSMAMRNGFTSHAAGHHKPGRAVITQHAGMWPRNPQKKMRMC